MLFALPFTAVIPALQRNLSKIHQGNLQNLGKAAAELVVRLTEVTNHGPDQAFEISHPHVNDIAVCAGIKCNELLIGYLPVQINGKTEHRA